MVHIIVRPYSSHGQSVYFIHYLATEMVGKRQESGEENKLYLHKYKMNPTEKIDNPIRPNISFAQFLSPEANNTILICLPYLFVLYKHEHNILPAAALDFLSATP